MINVNICLLERSERYANYSAELSDLRFNSFPAKFVVPGLGNGQAFVPIDQEYSDGELQAVKYGQICGCVRITIFND